MKIGVIQLTSKIDYKENLETIHFHMNHAKEAGVECIFLPECFYSLSNGKEASPHLVEGENEHYQNIKSLATDFGMYIIGGSAATLVDGKVVNRAFNFDPAGNDLGHYDKMHLFSCNLKKDQTTIDEADIYTPGTTPKIVNVKNFKVGLGICFDLRYPEMSRDYVRNGANLLTFSSAFTVPTGKAHWHTLVRARAIENQCFVVAAAQWGKNNENISTYGHSLVVDPWGEILVDAGEDEDLLVVDINLDKVQETRNKVKVF